MKKPRWGDRGFARKDDPGSGKSAGEERSSYQANATNVVMISAKDCDRLPHLMKHGDITHVRVARVQ